MTISFKYLLITALFFCISAPLFSRSVNVGVKTVVIDPGHGGRDPGTVGKHIKEKDIVLSIALRFGQLVEEWFPDVRVLYTRKTDVFVDLYKRGEFANENSADIFISIHANSIDASEEERNATSGNETWIMGMHRSEENLRVAMMENRVIQTEDRYEENYGGFDPTEPESYIVFSLIQDVYMEQSLRMAEYIQNEMQNGPVRRNRGVKQAGYVVLWKTAAPSVLIETGFVSNPKEEKILMDANNQQQIAECIFRAFQRYKNDMDRIVYSYGDDK
ncbi:MAG: N-acetylmuramoyl-L-alanine amidase [Prevotellaceae bacterium]|jgi:N-acetylmuramoyl-L-alanine amidase|nr:N-acetylmuramoyl-L-alanine amidase [Prevotellaceae bacterium]MDR0560863.1 N-acetylmuramoyl-L-alanine amidase [Prevotellaceae bacterium]